MKCVEVYKELYHQEPFDVAFCPYRISPLGAHIDHQYGKINGLAIDKGIHMAYHPKQNGVVELQSLNFPKRAQFFVNIKKHGISFKSAARIFFDYDRIEFYDEDHSDDEDRYNTIGDTSAGRISQKAEGALIGNIDQFIGKVNEILFVVYSFMIEKGEEPRSSAVKMKIRAKK